MEVIDLTMTAARRPDLLERTLSSFTERLFKRLRVRTFYLNIDPIWGTPEQADQVEKIARSHFESLVIRRPDTPSYAGAVKWLWSQPNTEWFLHLEDDWLLSHRISLRRLKIQASIPDVAQINLNNWSRLSRRRRPAKLGLCPMFCRTEFAKVASLHMDPSLDPDKQFRHGTNEILEKATKSWRSVYFGTPFTARTAIDIGREWRDDKGISKSLVNGAPVWTEEKK